MENNIIYKITVEDLQNEAMDRLGRFLTPDEIVDFENKLSDGLGETLIFTYDAIFECFEKI